ncbi:MAG: metallophosphoesterase family protein [Clostridia bacterium]
MIKRSFACIIVFMLLTLSACMPTLCGNPIPNRDFTSPSVSALTTGNPLINENTTWRYEDSGMDPALDLSNRNAWKSASFDDSGWAIGQGSFGAKDGVLQPLGGGFLPKNLLHVQADDGHPIPTYFFRTILTIDDPSTVPFLSGTIWYDDAIIVSINGVQIFADNLPSDSFSQNLEFGAAAAADAPREGSFHTNAGMLRAGKNIVSVELHQAAASSSDIFFLFSSLKATNQPAFLQPKSLALLVGNSSNCVGVRWHAEGAHAALRIAEGTYSGHAYPENSGVIPGLASADDANDYSVTVTNLKPNTTYSYWVQNQQGASEIDTFHTSNPDQYTFVYMGDPQITGPSDADKLNHALQTFSDTAFYISAGDQVYHSDDASLYRTYVGMDAFQHAPFFACIGNHDDPAFYKAYLNPPNVSHTGNDYAFSYGNALFVCIDTNNSDYDAHAAFLRQTIMDKDLPWVIVSMHHSLFGAGNHAGEASSSELQRKYAALFSSLNVDLVLSGHDHIYARTHLMENTTPVSGIGETNLQKNDGQTLYISAGTSTGSKYYEEQTINVAALACVQQEQFPVLLRVNVTKDAISIAAIQSNDNTIFDRVTLKKNMPKKHAAQSGYNDLVQNAVDYIRRAQLSNGALSIWPVQDGNAVINPYFSDYAALALLTYGDINRVKNYITWRFSHLNAADYDKNGLAYTIYDYHATIQNGITVSEESEMQYDSADSYAATFLLLLNAYLKQTGDTTLILDHYLQIAGVINVLFSCLQDGLTVASPDYRVQYLMDNSEVFAGLCAAENLITNGLLPATVSNSTQADGMKKLFERTQLTRMMLAENLEMKLWDAQDSRYHYVIQADGSIPAYSATTFYPDSISQLFPIVCGVIAPESERAHALYDRFCTDWDWANWKLFAPEDAQHYWCVLAYCAALMQDAERLDLFLTNYRSKILPDNAYPFNISEAAWIISACTSA